MPGPALELGAFVVHERLQTVGEVGGPANDRRVRHHRGLGCQIVQGSTP
jgi:hypothetical protein